MTTKKKRITLFAKDEEEKKRKIATVSISDNTEYERMLKRYKALGLHTRTTEEGVFGYETLDHDVEYVLEVEIAPYPPSPAVTPRISKLGHAPKTALPRSPPRDGINLAGTVLPREAIVASITEGGTQRVKIIHSSPATGKTSLLDLATRALRQRGNARVIRFPIRSTSGEELVKGLLTALGVQVIQELDSLQEDTWILIDDAQLGFEANLFWAMVFKDFASGAFSDRIYFIIAATYDLVNQGSTPYAFTEHDHVYNLRLTGKETERLYEGYMQIMLKTEWPAFKDTLIRLSEGHVGVLSAGINMVSQMIKNNQKMPVAESESLKALRDDRFRAHLLRTFPCKELMTDKQRSIVSKVILGGGSPRRLIDVSQGTRDDKATVELIRSGILSRDGTFSCPSAQWLFCNTFYCRPVEAPSSIEDLIVEAVRSMSALRLKQSCDNGNFPKEAAFQLLFCEALTLQLPADVSVCPELNTFAETDSGDVITGELDFFVSGGKDLQWAIEITRLGDKIGEHVRRFDPTNEKYRTVGHTSWIIVDCRGAYAREVVSMNERCTLYFDEDYKNVQCKMRLQPLISFLLKD